MKVVHQLLVWFCILTAIGSTVAVVRADNAVRFKYFTVSDGLPHISVNAIMQDKKGFIWVSTFDGLGRFDGLNFKSYLNDPNNPGSLVNNRVRQAVEHGSGKIVVGTEQGICLYNPMVDAFEKTGIPGLDDQSLNVIRLFVDSRERLWISTRPNKLMVADLDQEWLLSKSIQENQSDDQATFVIDFVEDRDGYIWMCTSKHLKCFDPNLGLMETILPDDMEHVRYNSLAIDSNNRLWLSSTDGLYVFNLHRCDTGIELTLNKHLLPGITTRNPLVGSGGNLWVYEPRNGLYNIVFSDDHVKRIEHIVKDNQVENSLKENHITCLFMDRQGGLWVGIHDSGVNYHNQNNIYFQHFCEQNGMPGNSVISACRYDDEKWLAGVVWAGIGVYNIGKNMIEKPWFDLNGIKDLIIMDMHVDHRKILWIATNRGLYYLLPGGIKVYASLVVNEIIWSEPVIKSVCSDDAGYLWVGHNKGLVRILTDDKANILEMINFNDPETNPQSIFDAEVKVIYNDPVNESMWVGTFYDGLFRFSPNNSQPQSIDDFVVRNFRCDPLNPEALQSNFIGDILRDSSGRLWVGTEGGGFGELIEKDGVVSFHNYMVKDGLSHNVVKRIMEDDHGHLLISTNNKLNYFDPSSSGFFHFSARNGLKSDYFSNAAAKLDDGRILFGGNNGISIANPALISETDQFPALYFGQFKLFSRVIRPGESVDKKTILETSLYYADQITLKHNQNTFSVELSGIGFQNLDQVRLKYRLKGYDNDWQYAWATGNNMVTYTRVPPGSYVLEYYMSNPAGLWNEHPKELKIQVRPPFWLTGWAIALYALLAMVIIYVSFAIVLKFDRMKGDVRVSQIEKEKEKELTEAKLRFFTNISHEFRTPLTLINGPVEFILTQYHSNDFLRHNLNLVKKQTNYLLRLLDQLLEFRKSEMKPLTLKWYKTDIVKFVWQITKSFNSLAIRKNIQFEYVSDKGAIDLYFDPQMIEKVIYNLLSNAFKYTPECGRISLRIGWGSEGFIRITVKDSGVGIPDTDIERVFERFYQVSNNMNQHGTGIGLSLSRLLVELHGGRIHAEKGLSRGAVIIVELPLGKAHLENTDVVEDDKVSPSDIYLDIVEETVSEKPSWEHVRSKTEGRPKLVVVDDNFDMRDFISEIFHDAFDVFQYKDGKVALNRIRKIRPDVVISDLMMPVMDGIELCRELRADPATSHTLFIILTGQYSSEMRLKGLEAGADDFIIKPFRVDYLRLKVKNMLDNQSKVKARYKKGNVVSKNIKNRSDKEGEEFLYTVFSIIQQNISNPEFTNEEFSKAMAMSATKLNTSLKRLTGRSPNELIRDYRVRKAAELLKHEDHSIQDILSLCGFHSRSYFYKCFREVFHTAPVQYQKQQNSKETQTKQGELDWGKVIR